jgi:hypothetical protein
MNLGSAGVEQAARPLNGSNRQSWLGQSWKRWGALMGAAAISLMTIAGAQIADKSRTVEAEQFILRAKNGKILARLGTGMEDTPRFSLFDRSGKPRGVIELNEDGTPIMHLVDREGRSRLVLALDADGGPSLGLLDSDEHARLRMNVDKDGNPLLSFLDGRDRLRMQLGTHGTGGDRASLLFFNDEDGRLRLSLSGHPDPNGSYGVYLRDKNGKGRILCSIDGDGEPSLTVLDKDENELFHVPVPPAPKAK